MLNCELLFISVVKTCRNCCLNVYMYIFSLKEKWCIVFLKFIFLNLQCVRSLFKIKDTMKCFDMLIVCNASIYCRVLAVEMELISQYWTRLGTCSRSSWVTHLFHHMWSLPFEALTVSLVLSQEHAGQRPAHSHHFLASSPALK